MISAEDCTTFLDVAFLEYNPIIVGMEQNCLKLSAKRGLLPVALGRSLTSVGKSNPVESTF